MTVEVLKVGEVAELLGCAVTTVEVHARAGDLPGLKFGDHWVFPAGALARRLEEWALEEAAERRRSRAAATDPLPAASKLKRSPRA